MFVITARDWEYTVVVGVATSKENGINLAKAWLSSQDVEERNMSLTFFSAKITDNIAYEGRADEECVLIDAEELI